MNYSRADYERAAAIIRGHTRHHPDIGLVLGSGMKGLADELQDADVIPYAAIPGWPPSTAPGHVGELVIGRLEGQTVMTQRGRAHFYEGYSMQQVTFAIRVMHFVGVHTLILTNAAGGLNKSYHVGDLMLINDHINFVGMTGSNPLIGLNDSELGPRFPGMSHSYDRALTKTALRIAGENSVPAHEGVYVCLSGPAYETPAEVRMLQMMGGDAVGMSTVHEVLVARHMGMRVLACSGISNLAIDHLEAEGDPNEQEVLDAGAVLVPRLTTVLKGVLRTL